MVYITYKEFNMMSANRAIEIPKGSLCECINGILHFSGIPICKADSENGHKHFTQNSDGMGLTRGKLTQSIQQRLSIRDDDYQERWDRIWEDSVCQKYKRTTHADHWLWNHEFFTAPILELRYIANLINAKEDMYV